MSNSPYVAMSRAVAKALRQARPKGISQEAAATLALHRNRSKLSRAENGSGWQVDAAELFLLLNLYGELGLDPVNFVVQVLSAYQHEMGFPLDESIPIPVEAEETECPDVSLTAKRLTAIAPVAIVA